MSDDVSDDVPGEFSVGVVVDAAADDVWRALTDPAAIAAWMREPAMDVRVATSWQIGSPIVITGFLHGRFENRGVVLVSDGPRHLRYTHLSSISRLPDVAESYTICDFVLAPLEQKTLLTATFSGFPTVSIFKHLSFYWRGTLPILQRYVEGCCVVSAA